MWIDFFHRPSGHAGNELARIISVSEPFALTGIALTEVLRGLTHDAARIEAFLSKCPLLEPDGLATYRRAATISRMARAKGFTIATVDALTASIALDYGASVFTLDRDFSHIAQISHLKLHTT